MSNLATITNNILADSGIDDINVVVTTGSYTNPSWIVSLPWTKITGTPTTLSGYGITDAYTQTQVNNLLAGYLPLAGGVMTGQIVLKESSSSTDYTKGLRFPNDPFGGSGDASGLRLYATSGESMVLELYVQNDSGTDKINFATGAGGGLSNDDVTINGNKIWNAGNLPNPQSAISLTTTGTSGAATLIGVTLNIPVYQSVLTNPITGSGTPNTLPRFTASNTIGDSAVTDNGTTIVLGRATSTLATATEANEITITQPAIELDKPVKLLNFNWYSEPWSIGNIRSSASPSNGLGVFATGVEKVRFKTDALLLQNINLQFRDNPSIRWSSNFLNLKNTDSSIPVVALRANGSNNQAPRLDMYNAADDTVTISLNGALGTGVFSSSLTAVDYRFNTDGYITYDVINSGIATFQIRKFGTNVLSFNASNQATFNSSVTTPTFFRASSGAQSNPTGGASVAIDYQTTSDIQGRIRSRDWDGAAWRNLTLEANNIILSPAGNVLIGTSTSIGSSILQVTGDARISNVLLAGGATNIDSSLAVQISSSGGGTQKWFGANKNGSYGLLVGYSETVGLSGVGAYIRQVTSDPLFFVVNNSLTALTIASNAAATFSSTVNINGATIITADAGNEQLTIRRASNTNEQLIFGFHSSDYARIQAVEQGVAYRPLALQQDGGNVLIGTTTDAGYKLDVNGTGRFSNTATATLFSAPEFYNATAYPYNTVFGSGADATTTKIRSGSTYGYESYVNMTSANLILGTGSLGRLTIASTGEATFSSIVTYSVGFSSYTDDGLFSANARYGAIFTPSGSARIRFGYFDQGGGQYWGRIGFQGNTNWSLGTGAGGHSFVIGINNGAGGNLVIDNAGAATFSSSVTATQFIVGSATTSSDVSVRYKTDTGDFSTINERNTHSFGIYDNQVSLYRLYITSGGNVLIGTTTNAGYKLDVSGTGRFGSNLRIEGLSTILQLHSTNGTPQNWWVGQDVSGAGDGIFYIFNATSATQALNISKTNAATFSSSVTTNGNVNVNNGSVFAGLGGPAADRGFYAGSSGFQASFLYNNSTGNLDISPRAGYNTIFTGGDVTTNGTLFVLSNKNASARFYGEVGFDGANRFYITNNAYIYGRNNLVLTGRLDNSNDGYSFGTNGRNSLVFNVNEGGAQGSAGTEYMSIQLQLVTKALYIQTADNSTNGRAGTTFFQSGNVSFGSTADAGYKLDVTGNFRASSTGFFGSSVTATSFFESSDSRIKKLLEDKLDYQSIASVTAKYYEKNGKIELGYFAQDFETLLPSAVSKNEDGYLNLSYREVHTAKIAYLEKRITELEQQLKNK